MSIKKATGEQVAVYNARRQLVGVVDSAKIVRLSDASALLGDDKASKRRKLGATPVGDESELQPAPADSVGVPADGQRQPVAKSAAGRRAQRDAVGTVAEREQIDQVSGTAAAARLNSMLGARRALQELKSAAARRAPR